MFTVSVAAAAQRTDGPLVAARHLARGAVGVLMGVRARNHPARALPEVEVYRDHVEVR
jgi:hypothetical protein